MLKNVSSLKMNFPQKLKEKKNVLSGFQCVPSYDEAFMLVTFNFRVRKAANQDSVGEKKTSFLTKTFSSILQSLAYQQNQFHLYCNPLDEFCILISFYTTLLKTWQLKDTSTDIGATKKNKIDFEIKVRYRVIEAKCC